MPANMFRSKWFELEVISVDIGVENISVVAEARVVGDDEIKFRLPKHNTLLLDQGGNRWYAVEDTAGLLGPLIVNLVPGTALRTKFRFFAGHSEKVPEPKPPFTLTSEEDFTDERIVIPGLRPE